MMAIWPSYRAYVVLVWAQAIDPEKATWFAGSQFWDSFFFS